MVGKMQKNTVNNKPVFIFNIGSVIPFEGTSSLNTFSSLEKCMFPSSLIFSLPGAQSWGPSGNRISPLWERNQQPATATPRHTCSTSCEKFSRSAHVRLTSSCYISINKLNDSNQQHRKKNTAPVLCFSISLLWIICLCCSRIRMHSCFPPELISLCGSVAVLLPQLPPSNLKCRETLLWQHQGGKANKVGRDRQSCEVWFSLLFSLCKAFASWRQKPTLRYCYTFCFLL